MWWLNAVSQLYEVIPIFSGWTPRIIDAKVFKKTCVQSYLHPHLEILYSTTPGGIFCREWVESSVFLVRFLFNNLLLLSLCCRLSTAISSANRSLCSELLQLLVLCSPPPQPLQQDVLNLLQTLQLLTSRQTDALFVLVDQVITTPPLWSCFNAVF